MAIKYGDSCWPCSTLWTVSIWAKWHTRVYLLLVTTWSSLGKHMFEQFKKSCYLTTNITVSRCIIYIRLCLILLLSDICACIFQSQCWNIFMFHVIFIKYEWGSSIEDGSWGFFSFIVLLYNILSYLNWTFCLKM